MNLHYTPGLVAATRWGVPKSEFCRTHQQPCMDGISTAGQNGPMENRSQFGSPSVGIHPRSDGEYTRYGTSPHPMTRKLSLNESAVAPSMQE